MPFGTLIIPIYSNSLSVCVDQRGIVRTSMAIFRTPPATKTLDFVERQLQLFKEKGDNRINSILSSIYF